MIQRFLRHLYSYFVPEEPDSGSNQGQTVLSIPLEGLIIGQDQYGEQNGLCFIKFLILHQETGKSYVAPTRGYGGYTHHVTLSVVPIALVSLRSLVSGLGSGL